MGPSSAPCAEDRLLAVAAEFYRGSKAAKKSGFSGGRLAYAIEDQGYQWQVTVGPYGSVGGGHVILIRKFDMQVTDLSVWTQ